MRITLGFPLVAAVCICSTGWAQERGEDREKAPVTRREASVEVHTGSTDQQIAALLFGCARNEVELSKIAQEKASSEEVRNFAAMMVKDHLPGMEKLKRLAGSLASPHASGTPAAAIKKEIREEVKAEAREPRPEAKDPPAAPPKSRTRVVEEERTVIEARPGSAHGLNWVSIHKQIADQCLASTKAEFQKKEGDKFDHCYMGQQIMAHAKALDELKVLQNYASAELRKDIEEATEMATHHLAEAKKIAESMKDGAERVSRKPKEE